MKRLRTQVAIVGGGPSGMLLALMLRRDGVDSIVIERQSQAYVLKRIRAGVLEPGSAKLLDEVGLGDRMRREGRAHRGSWIAWENRPSFLIDTRKYAGKEMWAFGQTAITEELYAIHTRDGAEIYHEAAEVAISGLDGDAPEVSFTRDGETYVVACDFVAGCDGFHGVARTAIPKEKLRTYERAYPFGWLGVMSETPPLPELVYARHSRGFALASQRNANLSRYYIQCDLDAKLQDWPDERFWEELKRRFPPETAAVIVTGPSIEKSIAPLRSFVAEPMRHGRLALAGDAAHIVPPTGAKGLNLAISDVYYLHRALVALLKANDARLIDSYSDTALRRVWGAERFSWSMTRLLHVFPDDDDFGRRVAESEFDHLHRSEAARTNIAEQYAGLDFLSAETEPPGAEAGKIGDVAAHAFLRVEASAYLIVGALLATVAAIAAISAAISLAKAAWEFNSPLPLVVTIDRILLILMVIEILHTVRVSFREGALVCEPFLIVGLIASIRRVLVITLESSQTKEPGKWSPDDQSLFNASMIELGVLGVLIVAMVVSIYMLRRSEAHDAKD